jgi:periplasmic protein TonB
MPLLRAASIPWALSLTVHAVAVIGLAWGRVHSAPPTPVTVEIIQRRAPTMAAAPGEPAPPQPPPAPRPQPLARRRATPAPAPALPAPTPSPAPDAPALPVAPAVATGPVSMAPVAPAARSGLPPTARPGGGGTDLRGYLGAINRLVTSHKRYPAMALQLSLEGTVEVRVCVNRDGTLACRPAVARSSGHEDLDEEALQMVARAAPLPPLPTGYSGTSADFRIPINFSLD